MPEYDDDWDVPEDRDVPEYEEKSPAGKDPGDKHKKKLTWKTVLLALVVFAIVGSLVQVIARGGFGGALDTTGNVKN